jgi:phage-related protein
MSEANVGAMESRMKAAREELESTKSLREAWDKAKGVFNDVWQSLENIGKGLLITIGEPLLNILIPAFEWLGKVLQNIIEFFKGWDEGTKRVMGLSVAIGTLLAIFVALKPILAVAGGLILKLLIGAIVGMIAAVKAALLFLAPFLLKIVAIGAAIYLVAKMVWDFGKAFMEGLAPAMDKIWGMLKVVGIAFALLYSPIALLIGLVVTLVKYWDEFYAALKPGIDAIKFVWEELKTVFKEAGAEIAKLFGDSSDQSEGFMDTLGSVMKFVAKALGWILKWVGYAIAGILALIVPLVDFMVFMITPIVRIGIAIYDVFAGLIGIVVDAVKMLLVFTGLMSGDTSEIGKSLIESLKQFVGGIITLILRPFDYITDAINLIIKSINKLPGIELDKLPSISGTVKQILSLEEGGITTKDNVLANLHADEAVIPLDKFPEVVGATVNVNQEAVVEELRHHRLLLERISRGGGMWNPADGG